MVWGGALALGAGEGLIEGSKCFISKGVTRKSLAVLCISAQGTDGAVKSSLD